MPEVHGTTEVFQAIQPRFLSFWSGDTRFDLMIYTYTQAIDSKFLTSTRVSPSSNDLTSNAPAPTPILHPIPTYSTFPITASLQTSYNGTISVHNLN
jgi:hypothetical protein